MPFYTWQGIGLDGRLRHGRIFATSDLDLEHILLQREIGLLKYSDLNLSDLTKLKLPASKLRVLFFRELAILLAAGIQLPKALNFLADQVKDDRLQLLVLVISHDVQQGSKLSQALERFPKFFTPLTCQLVQAGEVADDLTGALEYLASYLEKRADLVAQLRLVLLMPMITLGLFILITLFIFTVIIPIFATIFTAAGQQLHGATRFILGVSDFLRSQRALWWGLGFILATWGLILCSKTKIGRRCWDAGLLQLPGINRLIKQLELLYFWQTVHLLVRGNEQFPQAFASAAVVVQNTVLRAKLHVMAVGIAQGFSLTQLADDSAQIFIPEILAIMGAGEESGQLSQMSARVVQIYEQRLQQSLKLILQVLQPVLVIILGLLVALLIFAVYLPMFELPNIVSF